MQCEAILDQVNFRTNVLIWQGLGKGNSGSEGFVGRKNEKQKHSRGRAGLVNRSLHQKPRVYENGPVGGQLYGVVFELRLPLSLCFFLGRTAT